MLAVQSAKRLVGPADVDVRNSLDTRLIFATMMFDQKLPWLLFIFRPLYA